MYYGIPKAMVSINKATNREDRPTLKVIKVTVKEGKAQAVSTDGMSLLILEADVNMEETNIEFYVTPIQLKFDVKKNTDIVFYDKGKGNISWIDKDTEYSKKVTNEPNFPPWEDVIPKGEPILKEQYRIDILIDMLTQMKKVGGEFMDWEIYKVGTPTVIKVSGHTHYNDRIEAIGLVMPAKL